MCMSKINNQVINKHGVALLVLFLTPLISFAQFQGKLIPKKGLFVNQGSLQWAMGSEINFLDADRQHHAYYFTWWEQDADTSNPAQDILFIGSANTAVQGTFTLAKSETKLKTTLACTWNNSTAGVCDLLYTRLWYPFFTQATWSNKEGKLLKHIEKEFEDTVLVAQTPFGVYRFSSSHPFLIQVDTALHPQETAFTVRSQFIKIFNRSINLSEKENLVRTFSIELLEAPFNHTKNPYQIKDSLVSTDKLWEPPSGKLLLLPKPAEWIAKSGFTTIPTSQKYLTDSNLRYFNEVASRYWKTNKNLQPAWRLIKDSLLPVEGYTLFIEDSIFISYATPSGLQHAIETLGLLIEQKEQQLVLKNAVIKDQPQNSWRGIHMFTGPQSLALHQKMYQQILQPLKINKVVLQCEQATWNSFPSIHNAISINRADLAAEFAYLRKHHIEPIPLIQSLGHMEWFFKPIENRFLAINPSYPYTLNVTQRKGKKAMLVLWKEAIELLQPQTIHVGFDEIGMIGFHWPREKELQLFKQQLNRLDRFSKKRKLGLMIWGDMGLAPGEAPDACNGVNKERAAAIRASIPKNTWIADWHYLGNPDPKAYLPSIQLWKREGFRPLASPWFIPNNIRGFAMAANQENAGILQTTWADFESSEVNMLKNIEQFGAYVLALDYAWSGRKELPNELPYQGVTEWTQRFYRQPFPIATKVGKKWNGSISMENLTDLGAQALPNQLVFTMENNQQVEGIKLKGSTALILPESTPVAIVTGWREGLVEFSIPLLYGRDIRAMQDKRPIYVAIKEKGEKEWYHFLTESKKVDRIEIKQIHPGAGIQLTEVGFIQ